MKARKREGDVTKPLTVCLLGWLLLAAAPVEAAPPTRIQFAKGAIRSTWSGVIQEGDKKFKLRLAKGQSLMVGGEDVYTWFVITPQGTKLGCDGSDSCAPEAAIASLPDSGDYLIATHYRMSSCATCPTFRTRHVTVTFEAR